MLQVGWCLHYVRELFVRLAGSTLIAYHGGWFVHDPQVRVLACYLFGVADFLGLVFLLGGCSFWCVFLWRHMACRGNRNAF